MPASITHILTNIDRIRAGKSDKVKAALKESRVEAIAALKEDGVSAADAQKREVNAQRTWAGILSKAIEGGFADELPGTNGKVYAKAYRDAAKAQQPAPADEPVEAEPETVDLVEA